jgi:subtilisin family serine protease
MNKIILTFLMLFIFIFSETNLKTEKYHSTTLYSNNKFFVKTKSVLKISEATGKISVMTGISSLDKKNSKYRIKKIEKLFELNNGNEHLYNKLGMSRIYEFYIDDSAQRDMKKIVFDYDTDENVEYCELNYIGRAAGKLGTGKTVINTVIPNDEMFNKQWYLKNDGSIKPTSRRDPKIEADINMVKAWDIETGSEEVIIAICDSGIRDDNPDLKGNMWINNKEIPHNRRDDDGNGYVDDYRGWDFANDDSSPEDGFGHGTNIASVIGAGTNNTIGFAGINHNSKLMNCKNLSDDNYGEYSWWAESIQYAVDNGANIINMSEGGDDYSQTLKTAVDYANESGVLIVAAMMNRGNNNDYYPASLDGVFAIGATDSDDRRCERFTWGGGSCWGKHISVVAPGNRIYGLDYEDNYNYDVYWSGTSQSTAMVSALASLLLSQKRTRSVDEVKRIIMATARDRIGDYEEDKPGWDQYYGFGRIDCYLALTYEHSPEIEKRIEEIRNKNREEVSNVNKRYEDYHKKKDNDSPAKSMRDNKNGQKSKHNEPLGPAKKR